MIQSVDILRLRGIREGKLSDLSPLTVLVGPNGSGKSTVIEGILIGASQLPTEAVRQVIRRHEAGGSGLRWLLWKAGETEPTEITVQSETKQRKCYLRLDRSHPEDDTLISLVVAESNTQIENSWLRGQKNTFHSHGPSNYRPLEDVPEVHLVEPYPTSFQRPLDEIYTKTVQLGRRNEAMGIVSEVFPGVSHVEILTECGQPILHFVFKDHSVPATLAGDGIQSLLRLTLELAATGAGGLALLEEPEVHQHPGAIRQSARAIMAAVRRRIQIVLTTHSLELIDALLSESSDDDLKSMSLYRVSLEGGVLKHFRLPGPDVAFARTQIEDDLR